jgi:hypothetical protein
VWPRLLPFSLSQVFTVCVLRMQLLSNGSGSVICLTDSQQ